MHLRAAWAIPWVLAVFLTALSAQRSGAQEGNLLINGGFEDGTEGWLAIGGELTASDAFAHGGSYAGVFITPTTIPGTEAEVSQCLSVAPSTEHEFRAYASRLEGEPFALDLRVAWYEEGDCTGGQLSGDRQTAVLGEPGLWYEVGIDARSPANARGARLRIVVEESEATVYLDDFAVSVVAPTETPTVEPSASPTPTATPHASPTASSWQMTPVPVEDALRNSGFEEADSKGLPLFWHKYGGELARTNEVRFEGQFAAALSSQTSSTKWAYQMVTVQGGLAYVLSAHALMDDPAVAATYLRLSWYADPDGSGEAIDSADSTAVLVDDSTEFRFLTTEAVVAPDEAASAKVRLMMDPVGEAPGAVYFDAVTFEETALPEPTLSPTATPSVVVDEQTPTPTPSTFAESASTPRTGRRAVPTPTGSATTPRPSPTGSSDAGKPTPAALAAVRAPETTATAAATATATTATATRVPAFVFRQRKSDSLVGDEASARAESDEGGLSTSLLALAAGIPALVSTGAGVYYWRWRRARLR